MMTLPAIRGLADRIRVLWKRERNALAAFPVAARQALEETRLHETTLVSDVREWLARAPRLPRGQTMVEVLGQPAVPLYRDRSFIVSLNHRNLHRSDIHHHRSGLAYQLIEGTGLYVDYEFDDAEWCGKDLQVGTLRMIRGTLRRPGDSEAISAGYRPIHQVANVSRPQVTLVVKTLHMNRTASLRYLRPGVAFSRDVILSEAQHRRTELMIHLCGQGLEPARQFLRSCLHHLPEEEAFHIALEYYYACGDGEGLHEMVSESRWRASRALLRLVEGARQQITAAEPRELGVDLTALEDDATRLLALLTSMVSDRATRWRLMSEWAGKRSVEAVIARSLGRISAAGGPFQWNESSEAIFRVQLEGKEESEGARALAEEFDFGSLQQVQGEIRRFRKAAERIPFLRAWLPEPDRSRTPGRFPERVGTNA